MKKINNYIKKNLNTILEVLLIISPILDLFVSISINVFKHSLNIGIIVRMLILVLIYYVSVIIYHKKKNLIYIALTIIYCICYLIVQKDNTILSNLHGFMRTFYFPLILLGFYSVKDKIEIKDKILTITVFIYIILIFIAVVSGTGFESYKIAKTGSIGWFNSANEISGIISILLPILFISLSKGKNYFIKIILSILFIYVILEIGTKTPVLSIGLTLIITILYILVKSLKNKKYVLSTTIIIISIIASILSIIIIPKTNFYKNIKIHTKYLKITSVKQVFESEYIFDHFIFSQRITFLDKTDTRYEKVKLSKKLLGMGYVSKNNKPYKEIEMDYYDVWYNHGIIGFILFFGVYIGILLKLLKKLPTKFDYELLMKYLSLILILLLSLFSGHIITTPAVSIFVVIIIIDLLKKKA